jgi:hypothetical protein
MNQPGEYPQPLLRTTNVKIPIVGGCVTGRLRSAHTLVSGSTPSDAATLVLVKNTSNAQVSIAFQNSDDYVNGPFTQVGGQMTVKPLGQATQTIYPKQKFLEVKGITGTGAVDIQLSSQIRFEELGFDRGDGSYPSSLWKANLESWNSL